MSSRHPRAYLAGLDVAVIEALIDKGQAKNAGTDDRGRRRVVLARKA